MYFYLEVQNRKENKRKNWDAIKRATNIYKNNLNFGINMEDKEDNNDVKVLFFKNNEHTNGKYYVHMIKEDESWKGKRVFVFIHRYQNQVYMQLIIERTRLILSFCILVKEIQPTLKKEHLIDLKGTVDFTGRSQVSNVPAFLCLLRIVFLKYYMDGS